MSFTTHYDEIIRLVNNYDPSNYAQTRNYLDGAVSKLSPYISRGVISTKMILNNLIERQYKLEKIEKFIQELAWRDYWQQVWIVKGEGINKDLKRSQSLVNHHQMPAAVTKAKTGIEAVDRAIKILYRTGYMHNHLRMYLAAIVCNFGRSHWRLPAQWLYYYLLDGDWASNALSWQWVAGTNADKKYIADQHNINRFSGSHQVDTFLTGAYEKFPAMNVPEVLQETTTLALATSLPKHKSLQLDVALPTYLYNWYNLDPAWCKDVEANRVLLLEPSTFKTYPISPQSLNFMLNLARNIKGIQTAVIEFHELTQAYPGMSFHFKEHPLSRHYTGVEHPRDWLSNIRSYHSSFFAFWKKARTEIMPAKPLYTKPKTS